MLIIWWGLYHFYSSVFTIFYHRPACWDSPRSAESPPLPPQSTSPRLPHQRGWSACLWVPKARLLIFGCGRWRLEAVGPWSCWVGSVFSQLYSRCSSWWSLVFASLRLLIWISMRLWPCDRFLRHWLCRSFGSPLIATCLFLCPLKKHAGFHWRRYWKSSKSWCFP